MSGAPQPADPPPVRRGARAKDSQKFDAIIAAQREKVPQGGPTTSERCPPAGTIVRDAEYVPSSDSEEDLSDDDGDGVMNEEVHTT